MPTLERMIGLRGPRFWTEGKTIRFVNYVDGSTRDGPRDATDEDMAAHPEAFAQLDANDGVGKPLVSFKGSTRRPVKAA